MLDGGSTDWIIGNFIPNTILRSLKDPNLFNQPDTYQGQYWYNGVDDNGGVHINSGVLNKWFYILAEGENGVNDLSNYYNIDGIGNLNECTYTASYLEISEKDILVYPNPATSSLTIELPMSTESSIKLFDLSGSLIKEIQVDNYFLVTDISELSDGVYFLNFDFKGYKITKRLVIQK